ncbi:MAG: hypothetical protein K6D96_06915 [Acetatifactor sp.]|nr:hypothetical protein [Acetatifactor sp.]
MQELIKKIKELKDKSNIRTVIIVAILLSSSDVILLWHNLKPLFGAWIVLCVIMAKKSFESLRDNYIQIIVYTILAMNILITMIVNSDYHGYTLWMQLLVAILTTICFTPREFLNVLSKMVNIISMWSLICTFIAFCFPAWVRTFPNVTTGDRRVVFLLINFSANLERENIRNYGIYAEPAIFAIYIGIALFYMLFCCKKINRFWFTILNLTLLTTRSMTGWVSVGFMYLIYLLYKKQYRKYAVLFIGAVIATFVASPRLRMRFDIYGPSADSVLSRLKSIVYGFKIWQENPLWGVGAVHSQERFYFYNALYEKYSYSGFSWTNMTTYLFASFGILFGITFLVGLVGFPKQFHLNWMFCIAFGILMLLLLSGEIMTYSPFVYIFMFYGWNYFGAKLHLRLGNVNKNVMCEK